VSNDTTTERFLKKIATIARLLGQGGADRPAIDPLAADRVRHPLVVVGASAGGPTAIAAVLGGLPSDFGATVVIVQHVSDQFAAGIVQWLGQRSRLPVALAREGDCPGAGKVLVAGTGDHLVFKSASRLGYTPVPERGLYRPSVDVLFESAGRLWPADVVGVLLTGMGSDGAIGLKGLRQLGYHTIAQDRLSSTVYGMPKAAAALDAAVDILPVERIANRLIEVLAGKSGWQPRPVAANRRQ
jgi:two-component system response regulator WspF